MGAACHRVRGTIGALTGNWQPPAGRSSRLPEHADFALHARRRRKVVSAPLSVYICSVPDVSEIDLGRRARRLRVDTIVRLRWLAIAGQSVAVLFTYFVLGFDLPFGLCFLAIALSAWLNVGLRLRFPVSHRLDDGPASILLAYDVVQLSALLYLTGGLQNPFAILFLAPVMISATSLSPRRTLGLGVLTAASATVLAFRHLPLPWFAGAVLTLPFLYSVGIWVAVVLGTVFIGVYASRVAEEARRLSDALAAAELVLAREQHLSQLDGYAAAAAHELGTPLATITLVVKELASLMPKTGPVGEDLALVTQEVARCRAILGKLASLGNEEPHPHDDMTLGHLLEEAVEPHRNFGVNVRVDRHGDGPEPVCRRNPGMLYGLGNLIENAVDFARTEVRITATWTRERLEIAIEDDGPGFPAHILLRIGEPYVTSRGLDRRAKIDEDSGLGLGLFIAKTLLERSGAALATRNADPPASGAIVTLGWPRIAFERGRSRGDAVTRRPETSVKAAIAR
ncbi:MAG: ActS/PrrB/RegB family redox-sensitive histidine kinase [Methylobacteriaceae bacterium]|nr:ActS/PrrB/RegB family redox-sensitive histidine kinase [Methylobacteriaceae bacterium]